MLVKIVDINFSFQYQCLISVWTEYYLSFYTFFKKTFTETRMSFLLRR